MTDDEQLFKSHFSRRGFLVSAGVAGAGIAGGSTLTGTAQAAPVQQPATAADPITTPRVGGLHLQFGVDASSEVVVSWHTRQPVNRPRILLGGTDGQFERTVTATTTSYTDGGTSVGSNGVLFNPPACRVITSVGAPDPTTGKRPPVYAREDAPWSAARNAAHPYGFAAFTVDPGTSRGGTTTLQVTYYDVLGSDGRLDRFETFTLRRPRND
jgi:hypothetical protein